MREVSKIKTKKSLSQISMSAMLDMHCYERRFKRLRAKPVMITNRPALHKKSPARKGTMPHQMAAFRGIKVVRCATPQAKVATIAAV